MAKSAEPKEIELHPDAWERFERAIDVVVKSPPHHRKGDAPAPAKKIKRSKKKPPSRKD